MPEEREKPPAFSIYPTDEDKKLLRAIAKADGRSMNAEVLYLIRERARDLHISPASSSKPE